MALGVWLVLPTTAPRVEAETHAVGSVDAPVDGGAVVITPPDSTRSLTSGDSNSLFSLSLPAGASCPGDSYTEQWRVQSFFVPATDDPGSLTYGVIWPDGEGKRSLYSASTMPFIHMLTGLSKEPGGTGPIVEPAPMTFAVYPSGLFPAGSYRIGIACTRFRETAIYWDTEIVLEDAPEVQPGGFIWRVADLDAAGQTTAQDSSNPIGSIVLVAAAIALVALVVAQRRRGTRKLITQERP